MTKSKLIRGYIFVIASGLIFGFMPLMAKFIYAENVNSLTLVFLRSALALPFLAAIAVIGGNRLTIPSASVLPTGLIAIMGYCVTPVLLLSSYNFIPSGTATVFHFIYPAVVILSETIFLRAKSSALKITSMILCIVGITLFYTPGSKLNLTGSSIALLSGVTYGAYIVMLSVFRYKQISGFVFSFYVSLICAVVMFAVCVATNQLMLPKSLFAWGLALLFAVSLNVGAVVLFQQGTFIIGGARASILSTVEPITSVVAGALVFSEKISFLTAVGTVLVVAASVLIALPDKNADKTDK